MADKAPYRVDNPEPGRDYTFVHMAPELFTDRPLVFRGTLKRDEKEPDRSKAYKFDQFKEDQQYALRRYYPPPGTTFYEGFRRRAPSKSVVIGLSFLQKLEKGSAQAVGSILPSITLLTRETGWMRVLNVNEDFCKRAKIDLADRNRVYARLHPVSPAERFYETRVEFFNGAEFLLSDIADSWGMTGSHWNLKLKLVPLSSDDQDFFGGLAEFEQATASIAGMLPDREELPIQLPTAKAFPLPPQKAVPRIEAPPPPIEQLQLELIADHRQAAE